MKKNNGCDTCKKNCKDKSKNGYFYCPDYVEKPTTKTDHNMPKFMKDLFRGIV